MKKIGVNGLGRIGRLLLRHYLSNAPDNISIVAANDLTPADELGYLIRYDSVHRGATFPIESGPDYLQLGNIDCLFLMKKILQIFPGRS